MAKRSATVASRSSNRVGSRSRPSHDVFTRFARHDDDDDDAFVVASTAIVALSTLVKQMKPSKRSPNTSETPGSAIPVATAATMPTAMRRTSTPSA